MILLQRVTVLLSSSFLKTCSIFLKIQEGFSVPDRLYYRKLEKYLLTIEGNMPVEERNFGHLLIEFQPQIYGYIRSFISHESDAEEVFQEVASVLWRKFNHFESGTSFLAWALSVARYEIMYFWRKRSRDLLWFDDKLLETVADDTLAVNDKSQELRAALEDCVSKLTARQKHLVRHRYQANTSVVELAKELGRPVSALYKSLMGIRGSLRLCISKAMGWE